MSFFQILSSLRRNIVQRRFLHLAEHEAKCMLNQSGINVQKFTLLEDINSKEIVIKAQVEAGGRGKGFFPSSGLRGGVHVVSKTDSNKIKTILSGMLGHSLVTSQTTSQGIPVRCIMLAEAYDIVKEAYVSLVLDSKSKSPMFVVSCIGGTDIELVAKSNADQIHYIPIDPAAGTLSQKTVEKIAELTGLCQDADGIQEQIYQQIQNLYSIFIKKDILQLEINPFATTTCGKIVCFDSKITVDDNARFRQAEIFKKHPEQPFSYVQMSGNIGCIVNGAGLAMATMDCIKIHGGSPANFLDVGGATTAKGIQEALRIIKKDSSVNALFVNIFGGIVDCKTIAEGMIQVFAQEKLTLPVVTRMCGTNSAEGLEMLHQGFPEITIENDLEEATIKVVQLAGLSQEKKVVINQ